MRGRKPKPTKLKLIAGNPGKRPINPSEPIPPGDAPKCPVWLTKEAKKEWKRMIILLDDMGILSEADHAALEAYCVVYGRWVQAEKALKDNNLIYKKTGGGAFTSPMLWVANKALEQMHKFLVEFGLSPSSRSRVKVESKKKESKFQSFLNGKK